ANPILLTPTYESAGALFSTTWQTVTYTFTPATNVTHLTIGNFRNDAGSTIQQFATPSTPGFSYAYYYFDNISVVPDAVLPLELIDWNATQVKDSIRLRWSSAALESPAIFKVERSGDGTDYQVIGEVSAAQGDADFRLTDPYPLVGLNYYRLRYVLADGSEGSTQVLSVQFNGDIRWQAGPNPVGQNGTLTLRHNSLRAQSVQVSLWDMQGRLVYEKALLIEKESPLDLGRLPAGLYLLEITGGGERFRQSIQAL
ncbi:MAG: T9SS C-terminal target domain-containing protein, partial [Bacteroidetes bacterium]